MPDAVLLVTLVRVCVCVRKTRPCSAAASACQLLHPPSRKKPQAAGGAVAAASTALDARMNVALAVVWAVAVVVRLWETRVRSRVFLFTPPPTTSSFFTPTQAACDRASASARTAAAAARTEAAAARSQLAAATATHTATLVALRREQREVMEGVAKLERVAVARGLAA